MHKRGTLVKLKTNHGLHAEPLVQELMNEVGEVLDCVETNDAENDEEAEEHGANCVLRVWFHPSKYVRNWFAFRFDILWEPA